MKLKLSGKDASTVAFVGALAVIINFLVYPKISAGRFPQSESLFVSQPISPQGFFTRGIEGPAADLKNNLYVVNFKTNGTIGLMRPGSDPELFLELPDKGVANSIRFNSKGEMFVADYKRHRVYKVDTRTRKLEVYLEHPEMNQPNDFTFTKSGTLILSDPTWRRPKRGNIWLVGSDRKPILLTTDLQAVNGIDLSPDETKLYYSESISGAIYVYEFNGSQVSNRKLFHQFDRDTVDGIRTDTAGNLYVTRIGRGKIDRLSPDGKLLNSIPTLGRQPTNLAFGGNDGRTVYVTIRDGGYLESFKVDKPGREWALQNSGQN